MDVQKHRPYGVPDIIQCIRVWSRSHGQPRQFCMLNGCSLVATGSFLVTVCTIVYQVYYCALALMLEPARPILAVQTAKSRSAGLILTCNKIPPGTIPFSSFRCRVRTCHTCLHSSCKVEDLGIDPRLLEKWMARKEQKKQLVAAGTGQKPVVATRKTATVLLLGLSAGSVVWLKERALRWRKANGVVLAACIVAVAVGVACALIARRCA